MQNKETIRKFQDMCTEEFLYTSSEFCVKVVDTKMDVEQMWTDWPKCLDTAPWKLWDELLQLRMYNTTESGLMKATCQLLKH